MNKCSHPKPLSFRSFSQDNSLNTLQHISSSTQTLCISPGNYKTPQICSDEANYSVFSCKFINCSINDNGCIQAQNFKTFHLVGNEFYNITSTSQTGAAFLSSNSNGVLIQSKSNCFIQCSSSKYAVFQFDLKDAWFDLNQIAQLNSIFISNSPDSCYVSWGSNPLDFSHTNISQSVIEGTNGYAFGNIYGTDSMCSCKYFMISYSSGINGLYLSKEGTGTPSLSLSHFIIIDNNLVQSGSLLEVSQWYQKVLFSYFIFKGNSVTRLKIDCLISVFQDVQSDIDITFSGSKTTFLNSSVDFSIQLLHLGRCESFIFTNQFDYAYENIRGYVLLISLICLL